MLPSSCRSLAPTLLPRGIRHLLALAKPERLSAADSGIERAPGSTGDWRSTVHALNVLRVVFVDATLADDVGPYVSQV